MRILFAFALVLFSGCKSLEVAVTHPTTGIQVVARVDSRSSQTPSIAPIAKSSPVLHDSKSVPASAIDG